MAVPIRNSRAPEPPGVSDEQKAALVGRIVRGELTPREACEREGISEDELRHWVRAYTRVARRAVDHQVASVLAAHGLEVDELSATEFSGSLGEMPVAELIQTIQFGKKDALLRVEHEGEQSQLWCVAGDVVDAVSARLSGAAAVYRILSLQRGRIHADFSPVQRGRTIHASTQALMLEAAKRSDECEQIRQRLGDQQLVYVPSASAPSDSEIEDEQAEVLRAFDGTRSIEQVVHDSEFPDFETLALIERLLEQQWLTAKPFVAPRPARPAPPSVASTDGSFMPLAASAAVRRSALAPRQRLWLSALSGVGVVAVAFSIGFYSASGHDAARPVAAAPGMSVTTPVCSPSMVLLPGRVCLDRSEVSAGQYQACVGSGACEPAQREFEPEAGDGSRVANGASVTNGVNAPAASNAATSNASETTAAIPSLGGAPGTPAGASAPATPVDATARCNAGLPGREGFPINCVTFAQARRFCEWRGGRLPTRGEWEFAATSGGSVAASALLDGVSEWTAEAASARAAADGATERYVVVGGGLERSGAPSRLYMNANAQGRGVGFRCVVALDAPRTSGG